MQNGTTYRRMLAMMAWNQKMSLAGLILFLITAASVGNMNKSFSERNHTSCLSALTISLLGAFLGFWMAHQFQHADLITGANQANVSPVLWAVIGSVLLSLLMTVISRSRQFLLKRFKPSAIAAPVRKNLSSSKP